MNKSPTILTERLTLRKPTESDIQDRFQCGDSWDWVRMLGGDTRNMAEFSIEDAEEWYREIRSKPLEWSIVFEEKCIGQARLSVSLTDKRARYAIGIFNDSKINIGFGTEVTNAVLQYAFNTLELHRVDLRVLEYNHRAIACYKKCGFIQEGIEREGALIEGKWESDVMMSILEHEYRQIKFT